MRLNCCAPVVFSLLLGACAARGDDIDDAWREYDYQNFNGAARLFARVLTNAASPADRKLQARIGTAMVIHYRIPGADPLRAIPLYRALLDSLGQSHPLRPNLLLLTGRAFMAAKKPLIDSARQCFEEIDARYPGSIEAHEAALERAYVLSFRQTAADFCAAIRFLETYCAGAVSNTLASTMHVFCASLALSMQDPALARVHLIAADSLGVVNIRKRPVVLYQIGYLSERLLGDPATARKYYHKLIDTYPTDGRVYYCQLQLRALGEKPQ